MRTAADSLLQSIELAVAAEELGADGAYFRVHHFARQLGSPFPLPPPTPWLLTVPSLGVDYNAHAIDSILKFVAPDSVGADAVTSEHGFAPSFSAMARSSGHFRARSPAIPAR